MKWPIFRTWIAAREFFKTIGINPFYFVLPTFLSLSAALADGVSIGLLVPTVQGIINKDFLFIYKQAILAKVAPLLPAVFLESNAITFAFLILLIFFFSIIRNILYYFSTVTVLYQVREFANKTRKHIYARFLSFGKMFFDRASYGRLYQILLGYTGSVAGEMQTLSNAIFQMFSLAVYVAIGFAISWKLMMFCLIVFPILHYSVRALIRKIRKSSEGFTRAYNEMGNKISNALSCIMLVKAYSHEEKEKQWFNFTSDRVRDFQRSVDRKTQIFHPFQEIVSVCMILCLVGFMAFLLLVEKTGELGGFFVFFVVLRRAAGYFGVFNTIQSSLASAYGPLREIREIFDDREKFFVPEGSRSFPGLKEKIEFRDLNFSYVQERKVLSHLNFSIQKGETTALVGSTGSGKTTLIHLLMRFYDVPPGTLLIDGVDIREFSSQSLREKMALVSQETYILNASFKTNLTYGLNHEVGKKELEDILERSRLLPLVKLIGLDAPLGERGIKLSGGERQRLSIARAMFKNPEILILDEATSALDTTTEALIRGALDDLLVGRTAIVIAHRLATIRNARKILVLEKGMIVEQGSFEELLSKKEGYFYFYWQSQQLIKDEKTD